MPANVLTYMHAYIHAYIRACMALVHRTHSGEITLTGSHHLRSTLAAAPVLSRMQALSNQPNKSTKCKCSTYTYIHTYARTHTRTHTPVHYIWQQGKFLIDLASVRTSQQSLVHSAVYQGSKCSKNHAALAQTKSGVQGVPRVAASCTTRRVT
jgi:hypothetical protein